jgi:hypothetical protein
LVLVSKTWDSVKNFKLYCELQNYAQYFFYNTILVRWIMVKGNTEIFFGSKETLILFKNIKESQNFRKAHDMYWIFQVSKNMYWILERTHNFFLLPLNSALETNTNNNQDLNEWHLNKELMPRISSFLLREKTFKSFHFRWFVPWNLSSFWTF